jgi:hypothetical protein
MLKMKFLDNSEEDNEKTDGKNLEEDQITPWDTI